MNEEPYVIKFDSVSKSFVSYPKPYHRLFDAVKSRAGKRNLAGFRVDALKNISFLVGEGERVALIGRNGSGKSTLLQILAGVLEPTSGECRVNGAISAILELGAGFNPDYTGRENCHLAGVIGGLDNDRLNDFVEKSIEFSELERFIDQPLRTYSSGMYVRLAFSVAVNIDPRVLVVDEALAVGDVFFQQKCISYLESNFSNVTQLIVTHDLGLVSRIATRAILIDDGAVLYDGPPLGAVEMYMALDHRRSVGSSSLSSDQDKGRVSLSASASSPDEDPLFNALVPKDLNSNPEVIAISRLAIWVRASSDSSEVVVSRDLVPVEPGSVVHIRMMVDVSKDVSNLIVGYFFRDRLGNPIFGSTTVDDGGRPASVSAGCHVMEFDLGWPDIAPGDYTLNIGFGEGSHPMAHTILNWVQGASRFAASGSPNIHGVFNGDRLIVSTRQVAE